MVQAHRQFKRKFKLKYIEEKYPHIIKKNTAAGIDRVTKKTFEKYKETQFETIVSKSMSGNYKYTYYKEKLILKSRSSFPRLISIPTIRDRMVLKLLHEILMDVYEIKLDLVQTVISKFINKADLYDSYIKIDISNFFGSLDHTYLMSCIKEKIKKPELLKLIEDAITNPTVNQGYRKDTKVEIPDKGVPQGVPIANVLAEIYFKKLDNKYKYQENLAYFRYVDDILILCKEDDLLSIKENIINDLTNEKTFKLKVNTDKTKDGLISDGLSYLGYSFIKDSNNKIVCNVTKDSLLKLENSIVALFSKYENSQHKMKLNELIFYLNLKITGAIVESEDGRNKKYGWLFFYSQINDITKLYHLDKFIEKLLVKYKIDFVDVKNELKSFVKAYYEITQRRMKSNYLYKPNKLTTEEKRKILKNTFSIHSNELIKDSSVDYLFYKKVYKKIYELEMDIQDAY